MAAGAEFVSKDQYEYSQTHFSIHICSLSRSRGDYRQGVARAGRRRAWHSAVKELLLLLLAVGHYGYEPLAEALAADRGRVFYIFQGAIGAGFFALAGLTFHRAYWPPAALWALRLVALWGLAEQTLVVTCGCARLWDVSFRAPPGQGICGDNLYGIGLAIVAWLAVVVYTARKAQ